MCLSTTAWRNATYQFRPVRERLLGVKRALLTRKALGNDLRIPID
jgi:hypothetical protein